MVQANPIRKSNRGLHGSYRKLPLQIATQEEIFRGICVHIYTNATSRSDGGAHRGEIIYPRGVFQRSRSWLVNFQPTRRVPPSPRFPFPSSSRRFSASEKHAKARRSFRENNFIIFGGNLSDLAYAQGQRRQGRNFNDHSLLSSRATGQCWWWWWWIAFFSDSFRFMLPGETF